MRFRKTITIFKGLKMNVSKSGISFTVGGKGVSANLGKKGVYLNTGIPGTGIYDRKKVMDFEGKPKKTAAGAKKSEAVVERALIDAEALTDAFVNIGAQACDLPDRWPGRTLDQAPDEEAIEAAIDRWLSGLSLPIDFNVSYEYEDGALLADLDLPEIEDLPARKATRLASGQVKGKDKSQKELKAEYARCVFGLGMFCASHFFAVTPHMDRVLLSAYTQRRDSRGEIEDAYIYSVIYEREAFEKKGYQREEPEAFLCRFKNRMNRLADGTLKKIEPYGPEDVFGA